MNHAIAGKPGDGKGLFSMRLIYKDVIRTPRVVITDLAVEKLPWVTGNHQPRRGFLDFLDERHSKRYEADERVFRLKPKAMTNFFLYRALNRQQVERLGAMHMIGYREVTPLDDVLEDSEWLHHKDFKLYVADHKTRTTKDGRVIVDEYDTRLTIASGGHLCVADEAWNKWPARGWSNTGEGILYYCSMVRRFGDDFWLQSQRFNDVDSILIDRMQDYWSCKNLGRLRFGRFKQPPIYVVSVFQHRPTPSSDPDHKVRFTLDKHGLAECYDTSGGVGVQGRVLADIGRKTQGLPLWTIPLFGVAVIWLLITGYRYGTHKVHDMIVGKKKPAVAQKVSPANLPAPAGAVVLQQHDNNRLGDTNLVQPATLFCVGYTMLGGPKAFLSDGSIVEPPELREIAKQYVVVGTNRIYVKAREIEYVPQPVEVYAPPPPVERPSSSVQVIIIPKRDRQMPPRLGGLSQIQQPVH